MLVPPFGPHLTGFVLDAVVHFIDAVTEGKPVLATGDEGLTNVKIIRAIIESAEKRMPVEIVV